MCDGMFKVLIVDVIGLCFGFDGQFDLIEVVDYIVVQGGVFYCGLVNVGGLDDDGRIYFFYQLYFSIVDVFLVEVGDG